MFSIKLTHSLIDLGTPEEQNTTIEETHERAHRGIEENHQSIIKKKHFQQMRNKIHLHINLCRICLENKYDRNPNKNKFAEAPIPKKTFRYLSRRYIHFIPKYFPFRSR